MNISEKLSRFVQGTAVVLALNVLIIGVGASEETHNKDGEGWTTDHTHYDARSGCLSTSEGVSGGISILGFGGNAGRNWTKTGCWAAPQEGDEYMHFHDIPKKKKGKVQQGILSCKSTEYFAVSVEVEDTRQIVKEWVTFIDNTFHPPTVWMEEVDSVEGDLTITYLGGKCLPL